MCTQSEVHTARCSVEASSGQAHGAERTREANLAEVHLLLAMHSVALTASLLVGGRENWQGEAGCHMLGQEPLPGRARGHASAIGARRAPCLPQRGSQGGSARGVAGALVQSACSW